MKSKGNYTREMASLDLCELMGGKFTPQNNSCTFLDEHKNFDKSVSEPKYAVYYLLQIFIGTALSFFGVFTSITIVSPWWYLNLIILIASCAFFVFSDWYREGEVGESVRRLIILLPIYIVISILISTTAEFGTIVSSKYWIGFLTTDPVVAVTSAMFAASLLNVFLIPKDEVIQILNR